MFKKSLPPEIFKQMRVQAGLTQEECANLMGWSKGTVANNETKECKMTLYEFERFLMITTVSKEDRESRKKILQNISAQIQSLITPLSGKK